jgi:radical SAM superfamily enzyme YgiQ (UPF0313 family)
VMLGSRPGQMPEPAGPAGGGRVPLKAVLVSTYELGHQPFGLASPAAWLRRAGAEVCCLDLAVQPLDESVIAAADLVAFYLPMHTATRIAVPIIRRVRDAKPGAYLVAYGLYAPTNDRFLRELGIDSVIGGEFEAPLAALVRRLAAGRPQADTASERTVSLNRQQFVVPDRRGLPALRSYASVLLPGGDRRMAGYTEATRGCRHLCRHCPVVPIYGGRFRVVQRDVVMDDVRQQVEAGAQHITFGDPDFFNGPAHAVALVRELHARFPKLTYDVTIKIEHLRRQARYLPVLRDTGCLFVTSAVEAVDERILAIFDKRHSVSDLEEVVAAFRSLGLTLSPTFVAFTPWTSPAVYGDLLLTVHRLGLVGNVAPVQYAIRLLIPEGSRLLELSETQAVIEEFDPAALCYRWRHPDPRVDDLQQRVNEVVQAMVNDSATRSGVFAAVARLTARYADGERAAQLEAVAENAPAEEIPTASEPWYCCAEPLSR